MAEPTPAQAELLEIARALRVNAYAPYSNFPVGAAIRSVDGRVFGGVNVENASYPESQCAEASALGAMVAAGGSEIAEVVVVSDGNKPCPPCGGCRQRLNEFASADTPVHLANLDRVLETVTIGELLPRAFDAQRLASN